MLCMDFWRRKRGQWIWPVAIALAATFGCSRQIDLPTTESAPQADQAPFRDVASDAHNETSAPPDDTSRKPKGLPFHDSQYLPSGTLLTVRLEAPILAGDLNSFEGTIDEPVVIQDKTILPRGTVVTGRVEFASPVSVERNRRYIRLALTSVRVSGSDLTLHTASLFARQHNPNDPTNPQIRLDKGHHLTFRLTEPVYATTQTALNLR